MMVRRRICGIQSVLSLVAVLAVVSGAFAARPSEELLPGTTKGYVSVRDVDELNESWNRTQLGELMQDPAMAPFVEDMKRQIREKFRRLGDDLGLTLEDLGDVAGGEASLALVQPAEHVAALVVLVDVSDHAAQTGKLLKKVDKRLSARKATKRDEKIGDIRLTVYRLPPKSRGEGTRRAIFFVHENMLCGTDELSVARAVAQGFSTGATGRLKDLPAYQAIRARCEKEVGSTAPQIRWFVDLFGFIDAYRIANPPQQRHGGRDLVKILAAQGFTAIQAVGGTVDLAVDEKLEVLHRTAVFAPPIKGRKDQTEKYERAARMLRFPNRGMLEPPAWVPSEIAVCVGLNCEIQATFDASETLVDALIGEEGSFQEVLEGIREDPVGPQIDLRTELVGHLGERALLITDYEIPITPESERTLVAVATTNEKALTKAIEQIMESDPNARRRDVAGCTVWEIVEEESDLPELNIESPALDPLAADLYQHDPVTADDGPKENLPSSAVCVAHDHLLVASHFDFLKKVLVGSEQRESLADSEEFQQVAAQIKQASPDQIALRAFSRTEEEYRAAYELIRQGRMPEAKSMLGRGLNSLLSEGDEEVLRRQRIDGSKLPAFDTIRHYFGPAGVTVLSEDNGWFVVGFMLANENP